jgi:glyoxylase-like metal-dependent hydrolase (beta-lactamase superfamily II)
MKNRIKRSLAHAARGAALGACLLAGVAGCSLRVPMGPDRPEATQFAPPTRPGAEVWVMPIRMGHVLAPRCVAAGEATCLTGIDIVHAAFLVKHPRATFLIDGGLSRQAKEDLSRFGVFDRLLLNFQQDSSLGAAIDRFTAAGWARPEFLLLTHAHWDHTSGLLDLDHPRVILGPGEAEFIAHFPPEKSPAVMPHHVAGARLETFAWDGPAYENFPVSHDLFGDGAILLVPLGGHTPGSLGVFVNRVRGQRLLFVGDAAWSTDAVDLPSQKLRPLSERVDNDTSGTSEGLWRLHHLRQKYPDLLIVPTHDGAAFARLRDLAATPR